MTNLLARISVLQACRGGGSVGLSPLCEIMRTLGGSVPIDRAYVRLDKLLTKHFLSERGQIGSHQ